MTTGAFNGYFDNATTSYPKPAAMLRALAHFYDQPIGSYGRGVADATLAMTMKIETLRDLVAEWLGVSVPEHVVFAENATFALNTLLRGYQPLHQQGGVVWISPMEHNALMRPLNELCASDQRIKYQVMPHKPDGIIDVSQLAASYPGPDTRLACINIESNVNGVIQPMAEIAQVLNRLRVPILCDATQCVGSQPLQVDDWGVEMVAFTGHKGLLGPTGTGGFYMRCPDQVVPLTTGGNGTHSEMMTMVQEMPDRFMAGTPNALGLCALYEAMADMPRYAISQADWNRWLDEIAQLPGITLLRAHDPMQQGYLCSLRHCRLSPAEMADQLYSQYGIHTRVGLHCAPLAHQTLGTMAGGTLRLSLSPYHTEADLNQLAQALREVVGDAR